MHSKSALLGLAGFALMGMVNSLPNGSSDQSSLNATLNGPPQSAEQGATFCNAVGRGDSPTPNWYWKDLHKSFKTATDIFVGSRKLRFARFTDDACGMCPGYPEKPQDFQVGSVDKLASGRCKNFKLETEWNSFLFAYGDHLSDCRIDVYDGNHCVGPITHSYEANAERHCQKIPRGGRSVHVVCGTSHNRVEYLHWPVDEVISCAAADQPDSDDVDVGSESEKSNGGPARVMLREAPPHSPTSDSPVDPQEEHDMRASHGQSDDEEVVDLSDLEFTRRIQTVVRQEYEVMPANGTAFAYFAKHDCGSCGGTSEEGTAMLLESAQCQTLPANFTSFFFKLGDNVQRVHLQVYDQASCAGEPMTFDQWDARECQIMDPGAIGMSVRAIFDNHIEIPV